MDCTALQSGKWADGDWDTLAGTGNEHTDTGPAPVPISIVSEDLEGTSQCQL